jgi:hypothetical protein
MLQLKSSVIVSIMCQKLYGCNCNAQLKIKSKLICIIEGPSNRNPSAYQYDHFGL